MKLIKIPKSLLYSLITIVFFLISQIIITYFRYTIEHYTHGMSLLFLNLFLFTILGMLLGLEYFIKNLKQRGVWLTDWYKLAVIVFPLVIFTYNQFFNRIELFSKLNNWLLYDIWVNPLPHIHFQYPSAVLLGFMIITSFSKKKNGS